MAKSVVLNSVVECFEIKYIEIPWTNILIRVTRRLDEYYHKDFAYNRLSEDA